MLEVRRSLVSDALTRCNEWIRDDDGVREWRITQMRVVLMVYTKTNDTEE